MRVSEIGEFGLIEVLSKALGVPYPPLKGASPRPGLIVDLGDDALVTERLDEALILTTDTMVAGVHFLPGKTPWQDVGWKALASNVSDVAAMGGQPRLALVTLVLPQDALVEDMKALYAGLRDCATEYGILIVGGDIVRGPTFAVTVSLTGRASLGPSGEIAVLTRHDALPGDLVAVTGTLGDAAAGLRLLAEGRHRAAPGLVRRHTRPRPRVDAGVGAVQAGVRCGMDVSDGLVQDLGHIARASRVGLRIESARIPLSVDLRREFPDEALAFALGGGEDYELLLIGPAPAMEVLRTSVADITLIGEAFASDSPGVSVLDASGNEIALSLAGWDHFLGTVREEDHD